MLKLVVLSAVLAVAFASSKKCPFVTGKYPFDETKFAGEWKVIAGSEMIGGPHKCAKMTLSATGGIQKGIYSGMKDDGSMAGGDFFGLSLGKDGKSASSALAVWRKETEAYSPVFKQHILATDYDNYAVIMACTNVFDEKSKTFVRVLKAGIFSRKNTMEPAVRKTLESYLTSYDFDVNDLKTPDQTGC